MRIVAIVVLSSFVTVFGYPRDVRAASDGGGSSMYWIVPAALLGLYLFFSGGHAPWEPQRTDMKSEPAAANQAAEEGQAIPDARDVTVSGERPLSKRRVVFDLASASIRF